MNVNRMLMIFITIVLGCCFHQGAGWCMSEQEKIHALLEYIKKSDLLFIRNGTEYPPARAGEHLEYKLKKAGNRIRTAEEFIRYIASRSVSSGKPYYIRLKNGEVVESAQWLRRKLAELEKKGT